MTIPGVVASAHTVVSLPSTWLTLPGTSGNYASVPDSTDLAITDDFAFVFDGALTDWTPSGVQDLLTKENAVNSAYSVRVLTSGAIRLLFYAPTSQAFDSTPPTVADSAFLAVGVTRRKSDGRVQFFTAPTGTTTYPGGAGWTQLGADQTGPTAAMVPTADPLQIGADGTGGTTRRLNGKVKRVRVWASIDGTDQRLDANFVGVLKTATRAPATITDAAKGATVTINGSAWDWAT